MLDKNKILSSCKKDFSFTVQDTDDAALRVLNGVLHQYPSNIEDVQLVFTLEGYTSTSLNFMEKASSYIEEELQDITSTTKAYYDLVITGMLDSKKVFTSTTEVSISLGKDEYIVTGKNLDFHWVVRSFSNRLSDINDTSSIPSKKEIEPSLRYSTIDYDPKGVPMKRVRSVKADPRFSTLDLNSRKNEELSFQQDLQQDQALSKVATQKLGKQVNTQQVSKSVQSMVDKMSPQKALDTIDSAKDAWEEADPYKQYTDTIDLSYKWYGDNVVLVDSFAIIDKIYYAADLIKKIAELEKDLLQTKSRASITKINKEIDQCKKDLSNISPQIESSLKGAKGYAAIEDRAKDIEDKMESYIDDYQHNLAEWKSIQSKIEKLGKQVEIMEALKDKYASQYDLPSLLPRYKELVNAQLPAIMDIEEMEGVNLNAIITSWRKAIREYRKNIESFGSAFQDAYDKLANILAVKAKNRSLF